MSKVTKRIEQAAACQIIALTEQEKDIYSGSGWKMAVFQNGVLARLIDPSAYRDEADAIDEMMGAMNDENTETWKVMCSCFELCRPEEICDDSDIISLMVESR